MVVVLPAPLTPTTIMTYGSPSRASTPNEASSPWFSSSSEAISSRRIDCSSEAFMYLSRATRSSMRRMIFTVVSTPTSEVMSTSSRSSSMLSSTFERPATARASFEKRPCLVFSRPALSSRRSSAACSGEFWADSSFRFLNMSNNPIVLQNFGYPTAKVRKTCEMPSLPCIYCTVRRTISLRTVGFGSLRRAASFRRDVGLYAALLELDLVREVVSQRQRK